MAYLVTGGTGFIGRFLVANLLKRGEPVYVLVRKGSQTKLDALRERLEASDKQLIGVVGDLGKKNLGISDAEVGRLKGKIRHFFHVAAIYDLYASAEDQQVANIDGTRNAIQLADKLRVGCFHHVSSIAAAGLYDGVFREDMFEEAVLPDHPYFKTKHEGERIVRRECKVPYRIYRPSGVVGHSKTGEIDKVDGAYYLFKTLQKIRRLVPAWVPMLGLEGGRMNLVPVDYVADAMDCIAHKKGLDGGCFHLTDPTPYRVGEAVNIIARAAHAPQMELRINTRMFGFIPAPIRKGLATLAPVQRLVQAVLDDLGIPRDVLMMLNWPTRYDNRETVKALKGSGIAAPRLDAYAAQIWDYWERHLDPDLFIDHSLSGHVKGKVVVVTGGSSGIGRATAIKLAEAGAKVIIVARGEERLAETKAEIDKLGGKVWTYSVNLADMVACDAFVGQVLKEHGGCDYLINNAGRSIRRAVENAFDRFHDYERTMQINYFSVLRLTMGFLPNMLERKRGHIINISTVGVLSTAPRYSAYIASKSAMDAFSACAAAEFLDRGINFTTINMGLVYTPMSAPTKFYQQMPGLTPEQAADLVVRAIVDKPVRIADRVGVACIVGYAIAPKLMRVLFNTAFNLFPESPASMGKKDAVVPALTPEQLAFAELTKGVHW